MMDAFAFGYREGVLHAESVALPQLGEDFGTPLYVYSTAGLESAYQRFAHAFRDQDTLIAYSVKANSNQSVIAPFITCWNTTLISKLDMCLFPRQRTKSRVRH